jgi:bacterioferritin
MAIIKNEAKRKEIVEMLTRAYWMEIETVMNYISSSINPDGVRAEEIRKSLGKDIAEELGHAQLFGKRIKELYGKVPGSYEFKPSQKTLQPAKNDTDIVHVIKGVIEAEQGAIDFYSKVIKTCNEVDPVTQDMMVDILRDEQGHLRQFEGFLKEYEMK